MTWKPIETAPRDGTPMLAFTPVHNVYGKEWHEMHVIWCDDETELIHSDCECGWDIDDFTHWMPLPAPPE